MLPVVETFLAFAGYWVASISVTFLNKYFLTSSQLNFSLLIVQNFIGAVCALLALVVANGPKQTRTIVAEAWSVPQFRKFSLAMMFTFSASLALNNICLRLVTVSFFQVVRSLTLIATALLSFFFLGQLQSRRSVACCCFVVVGFLLASEQEQSASGSTWQPLGVAAGIAASLFLGMHSVLTRKTLDLFKGQNHADLQVSLSLNLVSLLPLALMSFVMGEHTALMSLQQSLFWPMVCLSGLLTFAISVCSNGCIRLTSPLSHNISVQSKSVVQTLLAWQFYGEAKTLLWWLGNMTVVSSAVAYTLVKISEQKQSTNQTKDSSNATSDDEIALVKKDDKSDMEDNEV